MIITTLECPSVSYLRSLAKPIKDDFNLEIRQKGHDFSDWLSRWNDQIADLCNLIRLRNQMVTGKQPEHWLDYYLGIYICAEMQTLDYIGSERAKESQFDDDDDYYVDCDYEYDESQIDEELPFPI